jgi:hypothetical protein
MTWSEFDGEDIYKSANPLFRDLYHSASQHIAPLLFAFLSPLVLCISTYEILIWVASTYSNLKIYHHNNCPNSEDPRML